MISSNDVNVGEDSEVLGFKPAGHSLVPANGIM